VDVSRILHSVKLELDKTTVKNDKEKLSTFLYALTYKSANPAHVFLVGKSSSGKSNLLNSVLSMLPMPIKPEDNDKFWEKGLDGMSVTGISPKALNRYLPTSDFSWDHKLIAIQEFDGAKDAAVVIRQLMSEGGAATLVTEKTDKKSHFAKLWSITGKPTFIITTASDIVEHQLANRCIMIEIKSAVGAVLAFQSELYKKGYNKYVDDVLAQRQSWRDYFKDLSLVDDVVIPYASFIHSYWYNDVVLAQRSYQNFLRLIIGSAIVHQENRPKFDGSLVALGDDYEIARRLYTSLKFTLSPSMIPIYEAIIKLNEAADLKHLFEKNDGSKVRCFSAYEIGEACNLTVKSVVSMIDVLVNYSIVSPVYDLRRDEYHAGKQFMRYQLASSTESALKLPDFKVLCQLDPMKSITDFNFVYDKDNQTWDIVNGKWDFPIVKDPYDPLTGNRIKFDEN